MVVMVAGGGRKAGAGGGRHWLAGGRRVLAPSQWHLVDSGLFLADDGQKEGGACSRVVVVSQMGRS